MSSREQPSRLNFTNSRGRGSRLRPDYGNRFYFQGSRGRGGGSSTRPARNFPSEPDLKDGLDTTEIVDTIPAPAHPAAPENFPINNVKYVASYNWTDAEKPTIIVPGAVLSFPYVFFLISAINSSQVHRLYGLGVLPHSPCSLTTPLFMSTSTTQSCPSIQCSHYLPPRTRYMAMR